MVAEALATASLVGMLGVFPAYAAGAATVLTGLALPVALASRALPGASADSCPWQNGSEDGPVRAQASSMS